MDKIPAFKARNLAFAPKRETLRFAQGDSKEKFSDVSRIKLSHGFHKAPPERVGIFTYCSESFILRSTVAFLAFIKMRF